MLCWPGEVGVGKRTIELSNEISQMQGPHEREMSSFLGQEPRLFVLRCCSRQPFLEPMRRCYFASTYPHPLLAASRPWAAALRRSVVATYCVCVV